MANLLSLSAFARLAGVKQPMIPKLVKQGKLTKILDADGKPAIDANAPDSLAYLGARRLAGWEPPTAAAPPPKLAAKKQPARVRTAKATTVKSTFEALDGVAIRTKPGSKPVKDDDRGGEAPPLDGLPDYSKTDPAKIPVSHLPPEVQREKIATSRLAREIKKGEYIHREVMGRFIAKLWRVHFGQIRPLGNTAAAQVAAALGIRDEALILKAEEKIDDLVFPMLTEIKRQMAKWINDTKADADLTDPVAGEETE